MEYTVEFNINEFPAWSNAVDTIEKVQAADKVEEFEKFLEDIFSDTYPTINEVNEFLAFEQDYIFKSLGINQNNKADFGDIEDEEDFTEKENMDYVDKDDFED